MDLLASSSLWMLAAAMLLLGGGFAAGWWGQQALRWWRRDEEDLHEDFARLYTEGITHYLAGRRDEAVNHLTRAARLRTDVVGLYLILGNLYREKGLFDRAIRVHAGLLNRQELTRPERAQAHAGLGEDYRVAGLVERSRESFQKALDLDPRNLPALLAMSRFCIEERQWEKALDLEEQILRLDPSRKSRPLAFIHNEIGRELLRQGNDRAAQRQFQKAIAVDERTYPAHIFLGDQYYKEGKLRKAVEHWERVVDLEPRHLPLVFDRLQNAYAEPEIGRSIEELCRRIAGRDGSNWRARVLLARVERERGEEAAAAQDLLDAARAFPRSLTVPHELLRMTAHRGVDRRVLQGYLELVKEVNEFADPFICSTCRFRSLEYLWRCPQCFGWDTFAEERPRSGAF
jgi:lipopolysaccharide biosynthesis regulator YciM